MRVIKRVCKYLSNTCSLSQRCDVVSSRSQALNDPGDAFPDTQGGVMRCHGLAQLCQESRVQLGGQGRQQQALLPRDLVKAVQDIQGEVIGVRAGLIAASSQAVNKGLNCCMSCDTSMHVSS